MNIKFSAVHITVTKLLTAKLVYTIEILWSKLNKPIPIRKYHNDESYKNATTKINNNTLCAPYFDTLGIIYDLEHRGVPQGSIRWDAMDFNYMFVISISFFIDPPYCVLPALIIIQGSTGFLEKLFDFRKFININKKILD